MTGQALSGERAAYVHAALGDVDRALDDLEECVAQRDPTALWLNVDPRFDSLRANPRFAEIVNRVRQQ